jgi:hypothetical protein
MIRYRLECEEALWQRFPDAFEGLDWDTARDVYWEAREMTDSDEEITEHVLREARQRIFSGNAVIETPKRFCIYRDTARGSCP